MKKQDLELKKVYRVKNGWRGYENLMCISIPEDSKKRWALFTKVNANGEIDKYPAQINLPQIECEVAQSAQDYLVDKKIADAKRELDRARKEKLEKEFKQVAEVIGVRAYQTFAPRNWDYPSSELKVELSLSEWEKVVEVLKKGIK